MFYHRLNIQGLIYGSTVKLVSDLYDVTTIYRVDEPTGGVEYSEFSTIFYIIISAIKVSGFCSSQMYYAIIFLGNILSHYF